MPRVRSLILGLIAFVIAVPAGYAIADHAGLGDDGSAATTNAVPADQCPAEVTAVWEDAGWPRETFSPSCPTLSEAKADARELVGLRARGLEKIAQNIRAHGDSGDADELAAIEAELRQLRVPKAGQ
jgi:hypothetical protein